MGKILRRTDFHLALCHASLKTSSSLSTLKVLLERQKQTRTNGEGTFRTRSHQPTKTTHNLDYLLLPD